jgi:hypothetical protein
MNKLMTILCGSVIISMLGLSLLQMRRAHKSQRSIIGALVKGFLTRRLFMSSKVQFTVTTIKVKQLSK